MNTQLLEGAAKVAMDTGEYKFVGDMLSAALGAGKTTITDIPPEPGLLKIGTIINGPLGKGKIVGYNSHKGMFYGQDKYPLIILFDTGYQDCYGKNEITPV